MTLRATSIARARFVTEAPWDVAILEASGRHLRRKLIILRGGSEILVDLVAPAMLEDRDCLVLEDGRLVRILAAEEDLLEVRGRDAAHLLQLAWHIGNRHLEAQVEKGRILIRRDHVIAHMLEHQGARLRDVREPFSPEHGAYHRHGQDPQGHEH